VPTWEAIWFIAFTLRSSLFTIRLAISKGKMARVYIGGVYEKALKTGEVTKYYYANGQRIATRKGPAGQPGTLHYFVNDHLRARYYDPAIGRFLSADPLVGAPSQPQTLNRYAYALNNPVNRVDPTGLASEGLGGGFNPLTLECLSFVLAIAATIAVTAFGPWGVLIGAALFATTLAIDASQSDLAGVGIGAGAETTTPLGLAEYSPGLRAIARWSSLGSIAYGAATCGISSV
jgi:RHS repeat-associated protein